MGLSHEPRARRAEGLLHNRYQMLSCQNSVQNPDFLEFVGIRAKLANNFNHKAGFHLLCRPLQVGFTTTECEVVYMDKTLEVSQGMSKNA